uniref:Dimer_Tnp_hAT domain-containing protein n=1 Tax=Macrostomum lignano TaxID=282301 RepID=A0A1I8FDX7_9PLAT
PLESRKRLATPRVVVAATEAAGRRKQQPPTPSSSTLAEPLTARKSSEPQAHRPNPELRAPGAGQFANDRFSATAGSGALHPVWPVACTARLQAAANRIGCCSRADLAEVKAAIENRATNANGQLIGDWREVLSTNLPQYRKLVKAAFAPAIGMAEPAQAKRSFHSLKGMLKKCVNAPPNDAENTEPDATLPNPSWRCDWLLDFWLSGKLTNVKAELPALEADRSAPDGQPKHPRLRQRLRRVSSHDSHLGQRLLGAAKAKSRFAEFRKKHLLTNVYYSALVLSHAPMTRPGRKGAKTPEGIRRGESEGGRRLPQGVRRGPGKESDEDSSKESGGGRLQRSRRSDAKTPGRRSQEERDSSKESGGAKNSKATQRGRLQRIQEERKTPGQESGGAKDSRQRIRRRKTPGKEQEGGEGLRQGVRRSEDCERARSQEGRRLQARSQAGSEGLRRQGVRRGKTPVAVAVQARSLQ